MRKLNNLILGGFFFLTLFIGISSAQAQRVRRARGEDRDSRESDFAAQRMLKRAQDLLVANESERGLKMLQTIIDQYPTSQVRFNAYLEMGKAYMNTNSHAEAIRSFNNLNMLRVPGEEIKGESLELYLEGLYLTGLSYYQTRQYDSAFPVLRRITREFPNTMWANQSYYYIGMCHFLRQNWSKAIEALSMVGTFVDTSDGVTTEYVEAGRRLYLKISDADLPVMQRLGKEVNVTVTTESGDKETVICIPLSADNTEYIGSISTETAIKPVQGDGVLQIRSGDVITTNYVDENTQEGKRNVPKEIKTKVVSTGRLRFTMGDFESGVSAGYLGQPLFMVVNDLDMDSSEKADRLTVRVFSRYRAEPSEEDDALLARGIVSMDRLNGEQRDEYKVRHEVMVDLAELGDGNIVRSGVFGGSVRLEAAGDMENLPSAPGVLYCAIADEIVAVYVDNLHVNGTTPREETHVIAVAGEIDARPRATQNVVFDDVIRSRKNLVEAEAYLELARIFASMGLRDGAAQRAEQGLLLVDEIIRLTSPIPAKVREDAFRIKWELQIVMGNYAGAIATCRTFNSLYPDSPLVDEALMSVGSSFLERENYREAINVFNQVLSLRTSLAKPRAMYMIAEAVEKSTGDVNRAIPMYQRCVEQFPDSEFAGNALAKLVDYYADTRDYAQANQLLERVFQDYPDAQFLDSMLMKWVIVAYRTRSYDVALEKCSQLIFEYPDSVFASRARQIKPRIEAMLKRGGGGAGGAADE